MNQLTGLVLTHHDHDHMGAAVALKKLNSNIKIYSSCAEAPFISLRKPLRLCQAEEMQKYFHQSIKISEKCFMLRQVESVGVDYLLHDGDHLDWCSGCRVIATPEHTP